ncbi:MAG TPA: iron-containing alcohol dehydrogenase [Allosphingosinicella sp.]|jgi:alcohol dehydrogenase class IV|uniref:iron-containing alcohol dehydrogenase n=1 Tax=Allosphingosinicella sp. TaxID=2823234 RepID=UPI002F293F76
MPLPNANWNYPTSIRFGNGRISELPEVCRALGIARPLLVTDPWLAALPIVTGTVAAMNAAGAETAVFSAIHSNPVGADVEAGVQAYKSGGHDGVIAFGGGSALDVGKVVAFMSGQTRPIWDFEDVGDCWSRADPAGIAPIVAVPTTAGTGSEVGRAGVILDQEAHTKKIIFHPKMMPAVVILDPELTLGLPPHITAATGMDALSHCLEAYCAPAFHPMGDGIAAEGIKLIHDWLPRAVANGSDIDARGHMLVAASMGATAFQKGLGGMHALSHPIGALHGSHHGLTNAVIMPYVLAYNRPEIQVQISRLAGFIGLRQASYEGFLDWILELRESLGIPHRLSDLDIPADLVEQVASMAEADPSAAGNPMPFDRAAARLVFQAAMEGRLR